VANNSLSKKELSFNDLPDNSNGRFFKMPWGLFKNEQYKELSPEAKLIFGLLLDRMELSKKNGWVDEKDNIYITFSKDEIAKLLNISLSTAKRAFLMLNKLKLIHEKRQGKTKPNLIFIDKKVMVQNDLSQTEINQSDGSKWTVNPKVMVQNDPKVMVQIEPRSILNNNKTNNTLSPKPTIEYFIKKFKEKHGLDPVINWAKDSKLIKTLLNSRTQEEIKTLIDKFFASEDKFIKESGYSIGVFYSQINKMLTSGNSAKSEREASQAATQTSLNKWR
jgi:hypothetical protein